jgi:DNA-binding transcriptional ArsR family regulator
MSLPRGSTASERTFSTCRALNNSKAGQRSSLKLLEQRATGPQRAVLSGSASRASSSKLFESHGPSAIVNHMVQHHSSPLNASFAALSDATRRGVLEQLGRADASISDLAMKFDMTLTGMKKHVGVLEQAGLVQTEKVGRVRTCRLGPRRLDDETAWLERHRQLWDGRFDALDVIVEELRQKEKGHGRKKR